MPQPPTITPRTTNIAPLRRRWRILDEGTFYQSLRSRAIKLGTVTGAERGLSFSANLIAARISGPSIFGAYALALSTASLFATYAGGCVGITANRFASNASPGTPAYRALIKSLSVISMLYALAAGVFLVGGAGLLSTLIAKGSDITNLLRVASLASVGIILVECMKGFLIGQRNFRLLFGFNTFLGIATLLALPWLSVHGGAYMMVLGQGALSIGTVLALYLAAMFVFARRPPSPKSSQPEEKQFGARAIFAFGSAQLIAIIGLNAAGWMLNIFMTRADATLSELAMFAVAAQFRNLAGFIPGLLGPLSFSFIVASEEHSDKRTALLSLVSSVSALVTAGLLTVSAPAILAIYGSRYRVAQGACIIAIATSIIHLGTAPFANRISICSVRALATINLVWTGLVLTGGYALVPVLGAAGAALALLLAHACSAGMVILFLGKRSSLADGALSLSTIAIVAGLVVALIGLLEAKSRLSVPLGSACCGITCLCALLCIARLGIAKGWMTGLRLPTSAIPQT